MNPAEVATVEPSDLVAALPGDETAIAAGTSAQWPRHRFDRAGAAALARRLGEMPDDEVDTALSVLAGTDFDAADVLPHFVPFLTWDIWRIGDRPWRLVESCDVGARVIADELRAILVRSDVDATHRLRAAAILGRLGLYLDDAYRVAQELRKLPTSTADPFHAHVLVAALAAVGIVDDAAVANALVPLPPELGAPLDDTLRTLARQSRLRGHDPTEALDSVRDGNLAAIRAARECGTRLPRLTAYILGKHLEHSRADVRRAALFALADAGEFSPGATKVVREIIDGTPDTVRGVPSNHELATAVCIAGQFAVRDATGLGELLPALERLARGPRVLLRREAARALALIREAESKDDGGTPHE